MLATRFQARQCCQMISERAAGYAGTVDLGSVKAAPTPVLLRGAIAAAMNAQDLLYDAVRTLRDRVAAKDAASTPVRSELRPHAMRR
jgi:hypothetical protein